MARKIKDTRMFKSVKEAEKASEEYFEEKPTEKKTKAQSKLKVVSKEDVLPAEKKKAKKSAAPRAAKDDSGIEEPEKSVDDELLDLTPKTKKVIAKPGAKADVIPAKPLPEPKKHDLFGSPSSLYRVEKCPGSIAYGKDIPDPEESEFAKEGTVFHHFMELCSLPYFIDDHKKVSKILETCTEYEGMKDHVYDTLAKLKEIWNRFREKQANCRHYFELEVNPGTSDVVFVGQNVKTQTMTVLPIDYKYGMGVPVKAHENLQGIAYALGAIRTLGLTNVGTVMIIIAQVRTDPEWEKNNYVIKGSDLPMWQERVTGIVSKAKAIYEGKLPMLENMAAGDHCRFCKCAAVCTVNKKEAHEVLALTAQDLPLEELVKKLTLDEQVDLFLKKSRIEDVLKAVAGNLHRAFETGITHPKLKLVRTNGRRKWKEDIDVADGLKKLGVVDPWQKKLKGLTEIEREVGKGKLDGLTETPAGKIELVEVSDKRPPVMIAQAKELE